MPICILVRHGETDWNRSGQVMGHQPIPLNQAGERQVRQSGSSTVSCKDSRTLQQSGIASRPDRQHPGGGVPRGDDDGSGAQRDRSG